MYAHPVDSQITIPSGKIKNAGFYSNAAGYRVSSMLRSAGIQPGFVPSADDEGYCKAVYPDNACLSVIAPIHYPASSRVSKEVAGLCNLTPMKPAACYFLSDFECELPSWLLNVGG